MTELERLRFQDRLGRTLRGVRNPDKGLRHSLRALREAFEAGHGCLAVLPPGKTDVEVVYETPRRGAWPPGVLAAFLRLEHPDVPEDVILAPLRRKGRVQAVIGLRRDGGTFPRGAGRQLCEIAAVISEGLDEVDRQRAAEIRSRIDRKIMEEIRPKDLFYQILHGLRSLTQYDHSSALLMAEQQGAALRLVAEQISWRKSKSRKIGSRLALTDGHRKLLRAERVYGFDRDGERWIEWSGQRAEPLAELLDYNAGADGMREGCMLCAPLTTRDGFLGLIKVAAQQPGALGAYEAGLVERFLPQASVALQTSRRHESLRARILDAERKSAVANLARGVSHDVNNALGSVLPLVQQLRADVREGRVEATTLSRDLDQIEESLSVCRRIFGGMLDFARGGAPHVGEGDLGRAVRAALAVLRDSCRRRRIELRVRLPETCPTVRGRQGDLEQLLLNLATNARDAMPDGGTLSLEVEVEGDRVVISIADTGTGIPPESMSRIQEPFFTTKEGGSGLGLAICGSIVSDMQGTLDLRSEPDVGTRAVVTLPIVTP